MLGVRFDCFVYDTLEDISLLFSIDGCSGRISQ